MPARLVVLVSGTGSNLQALLDACADSGFGARVVAVGADRVGTGAIERARRAGIDTFEMPVKEFATREEWDQALTTRVADYHPDLVVSAGFMKLAGVAFLSAFGGQATLSGKAFVFAGVAAISIALLWFVERQREQSEQREIDRLTALGNSYVRGAVYDVPVTFDGEVKDPWGNVKGGFSTSVRLNRKDFGLTWNKALDTGALLLGEEVDVTINLEVQKK